MKTTPIRLSLTVLGLFAVILTVRAADIPAGPLIEGDSAAASTLTTPTWERALFHLKQKWDLNDQELVQIKATVVDQMEQLAFLRNDGMLTEAARRAKEHEIMEASHQKILNVLLDNLVRTKGATRSLNPFGSGADWEHTKTRGL